MKFGLVPINVAVPHADAMLALARRAEALGLESVWTFEHAIVPVDYASKYPYSADGKMGVTPETPFVDPLVALAAVAAATKTLRLGTGVNILPQANPVILAKQAASLDFVSGGRFLLGVGIGWLEEEFDALGVPFERRGARFDDYLAAMRKIWSGQVVEHQSEFLSWSGWKSHPRPRSLPVVIGGSKGKVFERVASLGDGWFAPTGAPEQLEPMLAQLARACTDIGRDPKTVEITSMWIPPMGGQDAVKRFEELGVARLLVPLPALGPGNPLENLERFANETLSKFS